MFLNLDKFSATTKALFESQFASFNALASKAVEGGEKAIALNIAAAKAYAEESTVAAKQLFSVKDPQAFFALAASQAKLNADKAASYGSHLTEIVSSVKADFSKAAETHFADSKKTVTAMVDEVIKNAPAGSENAVAMLKSGFEQTKQALETVGAHVAKATDQLSQAVKKAA